MSSLPGFNDIQIVVCDKGFVFLGHVLELQNEEIIISKAINLRRWGTTKGLGELRHGKTDKTVYDPWGLVHCKPILRLNVEKGAWDADLEAIDWDGPMAGQNK